ncbi:hypothetical protein P43SY_006192 [Pythium insidiosum]|uniref:AMP-dependent synthetase/ligase domain-containing protein n=1 Tax=Pythium insidiosum TaxID=114742 RepID=A0AAD5M2U6_PYTIN|nr:hypothetical protein P43SY_006192 [Pythium insidiosum]KAJ0406676.1 hypothetical protein ATCC90586_008093 [Pythium insidiosum]
MTSAAPPPPIGVRNGRLAVFPSRADGASSSCVASEPHVIRGGLRATLVPRGLRLLEDCGVRAGDAFILVLDNDAVSVACLLASMELKCVCVLLSGGRVSLLPRVRQQTGLTKVITVSGDTATVNANVSTTEPPKWLLNEAIQGGGVGLLTSGSVGAPKVVACSWKNMLLQGQCTHEQLFPGQPARIICATSISHAYSINAVFTLYTSPADAASELCFVADTSALYSLLSTQTDKFTLLYGTPATYTRLLEFPQGRLYADVPYCAGTRLARELFEQTQQHNGLMLMQNYGSTETGDIAAWYLHGLRFPDESPNMASVEEIYVGRLWPGVRVEVEPNGEVLVWTPPAGKLMYT